MSTPGFTAEAPLKAGVSHYRARRTVSDLLGDTEVVPQSICDCCTNRSYGCWQTWAHCCLYGDPYFCDAAIRRCGCYCCSYIYPYPC
jgi:hypothetical protein